MSSLVPGFILRGARWNYRILHTITGDNTHISTIFKAAVFPHENADQHPDAPKYDSRSVKCMDRERQAYQLPNVASAECFRKMYDVIDNSTLALEWLETTLAEVVYRPDKDTYALIVSFLRATLTSCVVLEAHQHINTDFKPSNILLSNVNTSRITAKVGDLGVVVPSNYLFNGQPFAMRAPEVYLGAPCAEPSQVWAIAATLLVWIKPGVLGSQGCPYSLINDSWSMAKIKQLFPQWHIPAPEDVQGHSFKDQVYGARKLGKLAPLLEAIAPFDEETRKVEIPRELRDLLRFMMVPNPVARPSASDVLVSKEFRAFETFVGGR
ncbi:hypothetical protein BO78DRAFT_418202 [Aspergillus sclerotiicarbonarius CBS 121057]|uniref:Protein kinase domain-containing protein n=1 Tax=Aspergillus sclerotiicarbonarius (strain CBS 121057 / IBT 28362) TaxID=1448318 RepID=A0A319EK72_ASPSB|nr:hypothetical protein BO78DRAFT_418202 [Aspergillus sclerotiicarbonarius CBS 121057]